MHYVPINVPLFLALCVALALLGGLVLGGVLRHVSASLGISAPSILLLLVLSLIGSSINIPVAYLPGGHLHSHAVFEYFGTPYVVPVFRPTPGTIIADACRPQDRRATASIGCPNSGDHSKK